MADHASWRRRTREAGIGGGGGGATSFTDKARATTPSTTGRPLSAHGSGSDNGGSGHEGFTFKPTANVLTRPAAQRMPRAANTEGSGPAAPLKPLHITSSASSIPASMRLPPLPHPSAYAGADNWAFTPNEGLPSLPATPSRAMHAMGWQQRASTPGSDGSGGGGVMNNASNHVRGGSGSGVNSGIAHVTPGRDSTLVARTMLNKRIEDQRNYSPSPNRSQRHVVKAASNTPPATTTGSSLLRTFSPNSDANTTNPSHVLSPQPPASISAILTQANTQSDSPRVMPGAPDLHHRDSVTSLASSTQHSFNPHLLAHSRRPSQIFTAQSPALSNASGSVARARATPDYRVYRPPQMRTESYYGLQSPVAHYDRVSAPNLRGQSRSPSVSRSREESASVSRSPSQGRLPTLPLSPVGPTRRLSHLGAQNTIMENSNTLAMDGFSTLDHGSLIAKLANAKLDLRSQGERSSPRGGGAGDHTEDDSVGDTTKSASRMHKDSAVDDVDLTAEDMMMSSALTDEFCRSRSTSFSEPAPFVDILEVGDRLGPGLMHDGLEITIAETSKGFNEQNADQSGTQLEVISKLGEGSYAVVYLAKEVPRDVPLNTDLSTASMDSGTYREISASDRSIEMHEADDTVQQNGEELYSTTLRADASGRLAAAHEDEREHGSTLPLPNEGEKYFALKCLCKRDLSDEMLEVQRLEATIHQSIPAHPNIVTLYRTYETAEWLFLVLEYCSGQDLFFWLEQAHDTENLGTSTPGAVDRSLSPVDAHAQDSTPTSPSLLASTESRFLLSKRRLRLISRMFHQMCEAVEFCHARGISHRDIKPENFIVEDTRTPEFGNQSSSSSSSSGDDSNDSGGFGGSVGGIKVKLTDFGLAVAQTHCIDFDCGSKPYMSYECRNNTSRWYDPIESDIWSLGIVLLNLIFHRSPFTEPNAERCPSFASYVEHPVRFLTTAFRGLKEEAAHFLAENVFCDVTEDEATGERRHRISAKQFGDWASSLVDYVGVPDGSQPVAYNSSSLLSPPESVVSGADFGITSPMWHSRSPSSSIVNSLMASPSSNARLINIHQELTNMGISEEEIENFTPLFNDSMMVPPPTATIENTHAGRTTKVPEKEGSSDGARSDMQDERTVSSTETRVHDGSVDHNDARNVAGEATDENEGTAVEHDTGEADEGSGGGGDEARGDADNASLLSGPSISSTMANSKRRKRGARRGRTLAKQQLKRSHSAENLQSNEGDGNDASSTAETARDRTIRELAAASQSLAREMSKAMQNRDAKAAAAATNVTEATNDDVVNDATSVPLNGATGAARPIARMTPHTFVAGKPVLQNSGRSRTVHPSATAADWRERNTSNVSLASVSSFNSISSFSSDVGSIRSTASAPPALLSQQRARGGPISATSNRTSAMSSNAGLSSTGSGGTGSLSRGLLATGSNLGTINERGGAMTSSTLPTRGSSQKDLDASYLAEIFGGRSSQRGARSQQRPSASVSARSGHAQSQQYAAGLQGGALESAIAERNRANNAVRSPPPPSSSLSAKTATGSGVAEQVEESDEQSMPSATASVPRKKMLGKFLQGVKSYNKGVKAAPAMPEEQ